MYFEILLWGTWKFRIIASSWLTDPFIIIKYPFFVSSNFFIVVLKLYFSNATFLLLS